MKTFMLLEEDSEKILERKFENKRLISTKLSTEEYVNIFIPLS